MNTFSAPPEKELIRQCEVLSWLGITKAELQKLVDFGFLHRIHFRPNSKGYYRVAEIRAFLFNQAVPPPDYDSYPRHNGAV
jgi:hypothetical protein